MERNFRSGNAFFASIGSNLAGATANLQGSLNNATINLQPLSQNLGGSIQKSFRDITHTVAGKNTLPDRTTASQVLMFRQLLHTKCRPGLRLSRKYEGTDAQRAVLHMPVSLFAHIYYLYICARVRARV